MFLQSHSLLHLVGCFLLVWFGLLLCWVFFFSCFCFFFFLSFPYMCGLFFVFLLFSFCYDGTGGMGKRGVG